MSKPSAKEKVEKAELRRGSTYNIDEIFPDPGKRMIKKNADPLDEIYQLQMEDLNRDFRELRAKKAVKKLKDEMAEDEPGPSAIEMSPQMATVLAQIPDPETRKEIAALVTMSRNPSSRSDPMTQIVPLLAYSMTKANPEASQNDMVKMVQTMSEQLRLGIQLGRDNQPPINSQINTPDQIVALVKMLMEFMKSQQPTSGGLEQIMTNEALFTKLQGMGFFAGPKSITDVNSQLGFDAMKYGKDIDLKIEMFKQERADKKEIAEFQAEADAQKWIMVEKVLKGPIGNILSGLGGAAASRIQPQQQQQPNQVTFRKPATNVVPITRECPNCGNKIFMNSDAERAICPYCDAFLEVELTDEKAQNNQQQEQQPDSSEVPK